MIGRTTIAVAALTVCAVVGCGDRSPAKGDAKPSAAGVATGSAVPRTELEFLAELVPQPGGDLVVVYRVEGPAGMAGTLEVLSRAGGFRRENWTLELPIAGGDPERIEGTTIQTPKYVWSASGGEAGSISPSPLAALAERYLALDPARQAKVVESLRKLHDDLARLRGEQPGETAEILGHRCLELRLGAQDLCLWERVGTPLRIRGGTFTIEATRVDDAPQLGERAFTLPEVAASAREVPLPESLRVDPDRALRELEAGNYGAVSSVLQPGLRLPTG